MRSIISPQAFTIAAAITIVGAGYRIWYRHEHPGLPTATFEAGHMPPCDSRMFHQLLKQTLEEGPALQSSGFKVLKLGVFNDRNEAGTPEALSDRRRCRADVYSNAGRENVDFTVNWASDDKDELYLEVPESPF